MLGSFSLPVIFFIAYLLLWGFTVSPDSPQFSTLVAQHAPEHLRGTALTIYNSIGFAITVISLQVIDRLFHSNSFLSGENTFTILAIGPVLGLIAMYRFIKNK